MTRLKHLAGFFIIDMLGVLWVTINPLSLISFCMRNIDEFQVVLKLELGEGVVAHACDLRILCVIGISKYLVDC